jgi:alpha-glucosidase
MSATLPRRIAAGAAIVASSWLGCALPAQPAAATPWWAHASIYEIYVRSFQDSNGDGIGDLRGVTQRLGYLHELGVDAIWLTPFYPSPNADFGYDVSDYTGIAPEYGTLADWDALVREADRQGIRILVDLVVNHSSDQNPWFLESRSSRDNPKRDWYVWRDPKPGTVNPGNPQGEPPTNWLSIFPGPAWSWDAKTAQWYYHIFLPQQPDLNWANPQLREAMYGVVRYWLDHGASGFRLDATPYLFEDPAWPDDPDPKAGAPVWLKPYNAGRAEGHGVLRGMRAIVDGYPGDRILLGESSTATIEDLDGVYGAHDDEINLPMDFLIGNMTRLDPAAIKKQLDDAETKLGGKPPVLFFSSHDHHRQYSSFGDGVHDELIAKMTAALTLTPRATALLYYGEEIGMPDAPAAALAGVPLGPKRPVTDERDVERTPMQWSAGANAGFSTGEPWLPAQAWRATHNVEAERADPDSLYRWYAQLLKLRRDEPVFREGAYVPLDSGNAQVFCFARRLPDGRGALVLFNMSGVEQVARVSGWRGKAPPLGRALLASASHELRRGAQRDDVRLAPFASVILRLPPGGRHAR